MGADYSFYVKSIAAFGLTFFGYIISVLASEVSVSLFFSDFPYLSEKKIRPLSIFEWNSSTVLQLICKPSSLFSFNKGRVFKTDT